MRPIHAALLALGLALGSAGAASSAPAPAGAEATAEYAKWKGHKGHKMKAFKPGRAYGYYRGPRRHYGHSRGRHLGWYKNGRVYGSPYYAPRRVYYRF